MGTTMGDVARRSERRPGLPAEEGAGTPACAPAPRRASERAPATAACAGLDGELARERIRSARHINVLRLIGVSAFFLLFLVLGGVLRWPAWTGNLGVLAVYWVLSGAAVWVGRRSDRA